MAKLAILAAVFGVLLVAATARTTILKMEIEEEESQRKRGASGRCWDQLQKVRMLSHCQDFLSEISRGSGSSYGQQCGHGSSRHSIGSRRGEMESRHLDACCKQLDQLDERCMCEGLKEIVREELQEMQGGRQEERQVTECAKQLPEICGIGRSCYQIRAV